MTTKIILIAIASLLLSSAVEAKQHKLHQPRYRDINYDSTIYENRPNDYLFQSPDCKIVIHGHGGGYETHNCKIVWKDN